MELVGHPPNLARSEAMEAAGLQSAATGSVFGGSGEVAARGCGAELTNGALGFAGDEVTPADQSNVFDATDGVRFSGAGAGGDASSDQVTDFFSFSWDEARGTLLEATLVELKGSETCVDGDDVAVLASGITGPVDETTAPADQSNDLFSAMGVADDAAVHSFLAGGTGGGAVGEGSRFFSNARAGEGVMGSGMAGRVSDLV